MEVRPIESVADLRAAYRINGRAWAAAYSDFLPEELIERVGTLPVEDELESQFEAVRDECYLLAESGDDEILGYAFARWGEETKWFVSEDAAGLKELYVDPDHWGEGVGTELLAAVVDRLPEDAEALELETLAENDVGRSFYESRGFVVVDQATVDLGDHEARSVIYRRER